MTLGKYVIFTYLHIFLGSTPKAQLNTILVMVDFLVHVYCFLSFYFYFLECLWFQKIKAKPSVVLSQFLVKICCEWELFLAASAALFCKNFDDELNSDYLEYYYCPVYVFQQRVKFRKRKHFHSVVIIFCYCYCSTTLRPSVHACQTFFLLFCTVELFTKSTDLRFIFHSSSIPKPFK